MKSPVPLHGSMAEYFGILCRHLLTVQSTNQKQDRQVQSLEGIPQLQLKQRWEKAEEGKNG